MGPQIAFAAARPIAFAPPVNGVAFKNPFDPAVDGKGDVFFTDTITSASWNCRRATARRLRSIRSWAASGLVHPGGVAVDAAGDLYISDLDRNFVVEVPANGGAVT